MSDSAQPWEGLIGQETIAMLHAEGIKRWNGMMSAPQPGCIDGALGAARSAELYTPENEAEGFVPGLLFAAYLLYYVTKKHCYGDGNKRLGWACMTFVLLGFGLTIQATIDEAVDFCNAIADSTVKNGAEVALWMLPRIINIDLSA